MLSFRRRLELGRTSPTRTVRGEAGQGNPCPSDKCVRRGTTDCPHERKPDPVEKCLIVAVAVVLGLTCLMAIKACFA